MHRSGKIDKINDLKITYAKPSTQELWNVVGAEKLKDQKRNKYCSYFAF
jgi:hypothetical protein